MKPCLNSNTIRRTAEIHYNMNDLEQLQQNLETYHRLKYKAQPDLRSARARNNGRKQALLAHIPSLIEEIYHLRSLKESNAETIEFLSKAAVCPY